jgi:hypothetical protein
MGKSEYRITITMSGYGSDERAAEDLLEGCLRSHPEVGPVVSQGGEDDTVALTVALGAPSQQQALERGLSIWAASGKASGLVLGEVVRTEVERVSAPRAPGPPVSLTPNPLGAATSRAVPRR